MSDYIVHHGIRIASDFVPETFGRLTTIGPVFWLPTKRTKGVSKREQWQACECSCGGFTVVRRFCLLRNTTRSCGCLEKESRKTRHITHGESHRTKEYNSWSGMISRCYNKKSDKRQYYLDAGVQVCERWQEPVNGYSNFLSDMGPKPSPKHTLDRYPDPNGNYEPRNCRWATHTEQMRNRRNTVYITSFGKTLSIGEWSEITGISYKSILKRHRKGYTPEETLTLPTKTMPNPRRPDA